MPYTNKFWTAVTFEVSLDQHYFYRTVYTSLDFLSEIGGLFSAFSRICLIIITGLNYYGSFQFVMADNFYFRSGQIYKNDVQWNSLKSLRLNLHLFLPQCLQCCLCKPNKQQRIKSRGYDLILHETSVSHIIQQLRVLNAACKETRTDEEWQRLQNAHALIAFEDLNSEADDDEIINYAIKTQRSRKFTTQNNFIY